ncbi:MAG: hypothetical protein H0T54_08160 [Geodermatophilaceae bacterium]|nr:hypothetical protein [Geodermatophilaceae bacterium]
MRGLFRGARRAPDPSDPAEAQEVRDDGTDQWEPDSARNSLIETTDDLDAWLDDTGTWGTYDDSDDPEGELYEGGQTRRRILLYAVPIAALILVVLIAVFVGKQFNDVVSNGPAVVPNSESTLPDAPTAAPSQSAGTTDPAAAVALPMVSAAVFDPFGDGQSEHADDVGLSYDGDPASAWKTLTYRNNPEFGNLKPGVGIIFDLGGEHAITSIDLATSMPGGAIEIRVGAAPDAALDSYPVVGTLDPFTEAATITFDEPVRARFLIVWFVRLVGANGGFQGALNECRILGT